MAIYCVRSIKAFPVPLAGRVAVVELYASCRNQEFDEGHLPRSACSHGKRKAFHDSIYRRQIQSSKYLTGIAPMKDGSSVKLREFCLADLDEFYEWASDIEVTKFMTWEAFDSKDKAADFLEKTVITHPWFKAICLDGRPIGHVVLKQGSGIHNCRAEIGYAVSRKYWNMGFATHAVITAIKLGFQDLQGVERFEGLVLPENVASARVLQKAGFLNEGLLRKYVRVKRIVRDCLLLSYVLA